MSEVLHANIFFIIASLATVVFCILVTVTLYHVIKILRIVRTILERVEAGSEQIAKDIHTVRTYVASGGIISRIVGFFIPTNRSYNKRRSEDEDEE